MANYWASITVGVTTGFCTFVLCALLFPSIGLSPLDRLASDSQNKDAESTPNSDPEQDILENEEEDPAQSTQPSTEIQELLAMLMEKILFGLSQSKFFGQDTAPSVFIVYAHNNNDVYHDKRADDDIIRQIIDYLKIIGSKARSDKYPALKLEGLEAKHDIMISQFCLLPKRLAINPVDKVVLCYSEVLQAYCKDPLGSTYMKQLNEIFRIEDGGPSDQQVEIIRAKIRAFVESSQDKGGFHHVLTEIALMGMRVAQDRNPYTIIPINLHRIDEIYDDLPFLPKTQAYIPLSVPLPGDKSWELDPCERTHRLFFRLLDRIYERYPGLVKCLLKLYNKGRENLARRKDLSIVEFKFEVLVQVMEELERAAEYEEIDVSKPLKKEPEPTWAIPAIKVQPQQPLVPPTHITKGIISSPDKRQLESLEILRFRDMDNRFHEVALESPGTLDWVANHASYIKWIQQDSGMLGIRGKPGSGKSTILRSILEKLKPEHGNTHLHLYFFFHQRGSNLQFSRTGMYRTLLYQLLSQIPSAGDKFWWWCQERQKMIGASGEMIIPDLTGKDLREMLISALLALCKTCRTRIFLDALDEAGIEEAREVIADLRRITREVSRVTEGFSVCFTSRYYPAIVVDNGFEIRVDDCNEDGIRRYLDTEFNKLQEEFPGHIHKRQIDLLSSRILERSSGIFLWVFLTVRNIRDSMADGGSFYEVYHRIEQLLPDLKDMYRQILDKVVQDNFLDKDMMKAIVQWIRFAKRPLTLEELRIALASDDTFMTLGVIIQDDATMFRHIQRCTGGLVEVVNRAVGVGKSRSNAVIQFIHQSVADIFSDYTFVRTVLPDVGPEWAAEGHDRLSRACGNYIIREHSQWSGIIRIEVLNAPFCWYAVEYWFNHAAEAWAGGFEETRIMQQLGPASGSQGVDLLRHWARIYGRERLEARNLRSDPTLYDVAKAFNFMDDRTLKHL